MCEKENTRDKAKKALDNIIKISRVHFYKPIQIAEILYYQRTENRKMDLLKLENYRIESKKWRDDVCIELLGRKCTSSARFQDNLFEANAMPPKLLNELGKENIRTQGAVEAYIYNCFLNRYHQLKTALQYCLNATKDTFDVKHLIDSFWNEPGLKRSIDKIYEIIVYSLFSTLINAMEMKIQISIPEKNHFLLEEFEDFTQKIMCLNTKNLQYIQDAHVYRLGITNAADRGLDMYSNWGPAIQIKHLSLDKTLAENIVEDVSSDKVIIVCKDVEKDIIELVLAQVGWSCHIQSIVTEKELIEWYDRALRGEHSGILGDTLLGTLGEEITNEFPSILEMPDILKKRNYEKMKDEYWKK